MAARPRYRQDGLGCLVRGRVTPYVHDPDRFDHRVRARGWRWRQRMLTGSSGVRPPGVIGVAAVTRRRRTMLLWNGCTPACTLPSPTLADGMTGGESAFQTSGYRSRACARSGGQTTRRTPSCH
jgi:hypothetical protein